VNKKRNILFYHKTSDRHKKKSRLAIFSIYKMTPPPPKKKKKKKNFSNARLMSGKVGKIG